jgi:aryl-alcohol dehydrogenase
VFNLMSAGRVVRGIVEGESRPKEFLPRLFGFWRSGKFPVERMMEFYDFEEIDRAAREAASGAVIKPVLRMEGRE